MKNLIILMLTCSLFLLLTGCASKKPKADSSSQSDEDPKFLLPEVRKIWVPDKIEGNKFIKGHNVYILEKGNVWTMD